MHNANLDSRTRAAVFAALDTRRFEVLVIGGGITGAGIARDCALRGMNTALIEARDFAAGTSSRSSKMIHGGLRYLAQGDIGLVREAASERQILRRIAPHLTRITPYLMQVGSLGAIAKMRAALWTFEKLGSVPAPEAHQLWNAGEIALREPVLRNEGNGSAVVYPEFLTDDARLTLANIRAAQDAGATVLNYAQANEILLHDGVAAGALVRSTLPGEQLAARIHATVVINAAGPWVDAVRALEDEGREAKLMLTKGVHIVVPHARVPVNTTLILPAAGKRRIFVVPRGRFTYIGTTDTFYDAPETWPRVEMTDINYLFDAVNVALKIAPLNTTDIVSVWSGVRPLIGQKGKSASDISRKDEIWDGPKGVIAIAGGKLSAYRAMAERVTDRAADRLKESLSRALKPCRTAELPLPGGEVVPSQLETQLSQKGMPLADAQRLVWLYGAEAQGLATAPSLIAAEAAAAVTREGAARLEDWWARRSARAWFDDGAGLPHLNTAADVFATLLGWNDARRAEEIANCVAIDAHSRAAWTGHAAPEGQAA